VDENEKFVLRQYSKAIHNLTHAVPSARDTATTRVALVTCLVFIYLEFLRGHYTTAQTHLANGLKLLKEIEVHGHSPSNLPKDSADDALTEAFSRICFQIQLMMHSSKHSHLYLPVYERELSSPVFKSLNQARRHLQHLLNEIFHLTQQIKNRGIVEPTYSPLELVDRQRSIRESLASWLIKYKASKASVLADMPVRGAFAYELLQIYHTMASVMAHACLSPTDEWLYDSHTNDFVSMIMKLMFLRKISPALSEAIHGEISGKSKTVMDLGWIPPLYYTAIKCRFHRVRLQAIKLLESTGPLHKEGIWDSNIAACVARKVTEIEERGFYENSMVDDDFEFSSPPEEKDFLLPVLPDRYRVHDVQIVLPDDLEGKVLLSCKHHPNSGLVIVREWEYDMVFNRWTEGGERMRRREEL
jgi:Fungal specific transcription factor domain